MCPRLRDTRLDVASLFSFRRVGLDRTEPALSKWSMVKENGFTLSRLSLECFVLSSFLPSPADGTRIAATQSLDTTPLPLVYRIEPLEKERASHFFC